MKSIALFVFAALSFACGASAPKSTQQNSPAGGAPLVSERQQNTIAHSGENRQLPPVSSGEKTKWTQSGDPIETKEMDEAVATALKAVNGKPSNAAAKKTLSVTYFKRAVALTDARQYASALGDYRRTLKYDPDNAEAKEWIANIISIYEGLNKDYPKEGEEPPPLPFVKGK